jgi:hypothetical protein
MAGSQTLFYNVVKYGKFAVLLGLLTMALVRGNKDYVSQNPRKFIWDSIVTGATAAAAISYVAHVRGRTEAIPNLAFFSFLLFFMYNVFRELSGLNSTENTEKDAKVAGKPIGALAGCVALILVILATISHVPHPISFTALLKEGAVFGGLVAIGEGIIALDHKDDAKTIGLVAVGNLVVYFFAHLLLQFGGFYEKIMP